MNLRLNDREQLIFRELMSQTRRCISRTDGSYKELLACETAALSEGTKYTYHTHPRGTPEPSNADRKTTARLNKDWLLIGLVPSNELVGFHKSDNYRKLQFRSKL